jgi:hypothetical protein
VPKAEVPEPVYLFEWNPKSRKAEQRNPSGAGWALQPVTTIYIEGVAMLAGVTAFGALAGVAASNISFHSSCMYFPMGTC